MKIKCSVWVSDQCHYNIDYEIDSWDYQGIIQDFRAAIELRDLRSENGKLRREISEKAIATLDVSPPVLHVEVEKVQDNYGPHARVFEYDGAFQCLYCHGEWGALPGKPVMPALCVKPEPKCRCNKPFSFHADGSYEHCAGCGTCPPIGAKHH